MTRVLIDACPHDAELVARCLAGDRAAWDDLVLEYSRYVYAIASQGYRLQGADAEDAFQEVFLRVYDRLGYAAQPGGAPPLDRAADPTRLPRQPLGRATREEPSELEPEGIDSTVDELDEAFAVREALAELSGSARRCSTASSAATRATGRSATSSGSRRARSRVGSPVASASCASASAMPELPAGRRHLPLHRHRGLDAAARGARRGIRRRADRAPRARCARRSARTAALRSTTRATRSSSHSPTRPRRPPPRPPGRRRSPTGRVRVRMGLHTGTPFRTDEGYVGRDVNIGARVAASAHGGQVVVTKATRERSTVRPSATSASTGSRTSTSPSGSTSSATSPSRR